MQASMPAIILMAVGVAALGSWRLSATSNQAHETGENIRVAISQTLPRMDGDHLEAKAIEVTYQPGASSPAHSHPSRCSRTSRKALSAARSMTSRSVSTKLEKPSMKPPMEFIECPRTPARPNPQS